MTSIFTFEKNYPQKQQSLLHRLLLAFLLFNFISTSSTAQVASYEVMEVVEVSFNSQQAYNNPYMDADVWVELKKSGSTSEQYRIPVFWDGGNVFRARLVATSPGNWTWNIINATVTNSDSGFIGKSGSFTATAANVNTNPNNRGFIKVASNNRTLEYADGTPFFYTADTSWSALTAVFDYNQANSISGISFKDYISARKDQGFNGLNVIASFPDDTYTNLWSSKTWGKKVAPSGATPFEMKGPGQPVDYRKITPEYWQSVDERMQFLADQGFVTLFETVRRTEDWPFRSDTEKKAFYNYVRYLWARYGCYNMIFSWIHHDVHGGVYNNWVPLVQDAHQRLSTQLGNKMPYGQPRTAMTYNTSLNNWNRDIPSALDIQNVSNDERDETMHQWLSNIYNHQPAKPALNLEPFYPGWGTHSDNEINTGLDDTTMAQMQMYGSVLSGGLAGHAWGDTWYAGAAHATQNRVVPENSPQVNALNAFDSQAMGHLRSFILDAGHEYHRLKPAANTHLSNSQNYLHTLSISDDEEFALGFFAGDSRSNPSALPVVTNLIASKNYLFEWWNVTTGRWISAGNISTNSAGLLQPPSIPNNERSKNWAFRIRSEDYIGDEVIEDGDEIVDDMEEETIEPFTLRINSGGGEIIRDGNTFVADTYFDTGNTLDRPQTGLKDPYKTFRYSRSQVMGYHIPIENGEYTVRLHFAELWFGATSGGAGGTGKRVFDVKLEGQLAEDNLDVFANVGAETLLTRTHTVNVTDGQLDIDFSSLASDGGSRHPIINAIEILEPISLQEEDDLVGHWPLDERNGTNANDLSGQGKTGKLENGLTFDTNRRSGQIEGALAFDGLDDRINLSDINDDLGSNFSVSAWVKPGNANGGYQGVIGSSTAGGFMMFINQGKLAFKVTTNENGQKLVSAGSIKNNVWQMITCTFDGSNMHWYINGEHIHSESLSGTLKAKSEAWIGWSGWRDEFFQGVIDDVRLFNSAITEQEVISLFEKDNLGTAPAYLALADNPSQPSTTAENAQVSHVFPNPTVDKFKIAGLSDSVKTITVTDFTGFTVITAETDEIEPQLDLSAYPDGIYFVRVLQNGLEQSFKVVKE